MSKTVQGRRELHNILLSISKERMDKLLSNAPAANQGKVKMIFDKVYSEIKDLGISDLFAFFGGAHLSDKAFIGYVQDMYRGKLFR